MLAFFLGNSALASAPVLEGFFPAGGQVGKTVDVTALGTFTPWPVKTSVDSPHLTITPSKTPGTFTIKIADEAEPRVHWIRLLNDEGASESRPFFVGAAPEVMEKEPNNDPQAAQPIAGPTAVVHGKLSKGNDVDLFAVKLTKGQTLVAACDANRTLGSPMDGVLQIVSEAGFVLEQNDDYRGIDPLVTFTAPTDGTYFVRIFAFPSMTDATIAFSGSEKHIYRLMITTQGYATHTLPLSVPFDRDATVAVQGFNLISNGSAFPASKMFRPGVWWLVPPGCTEGTAVQRDRWPSRFHSAKPLDAKPTELTLPIAITGRFDRPDQVDAFVIPGKKGQKVMLKAMGRSLDFRAEPALTWIAPDGKSLGEASPPGKIGDPTILQGAMPVDGMYRLEVKDLYGRFGPRHVYRVEAKFVEPDFALTVTTDRFVVSPNAPAEITINLDRQNGWKGDVELIAQDLARGLTLDTKTVAKDGKQLKVRVLAEANAESSRFRLIGRSNGQERDVLFTDSTFRRTSDELWLTVAKTAPKK